MRATAQINEVALLIERHINLALTAEFLNLIDLVRLRPLREKGGSVGNAHDAALKRFLGLGDAVDLGLNGREVVLGHWCVEFEVVIKAVLDGRPKPKARAREQRHDGLGHYVRGRMAHHVQVIITALAGDDRNRLAIGQGPRQVAHLVANPHGKCRLCQAGADRGGGVKAGGAVGQFELGSIGKDHVHGGGGCYSYTL